ncbi:MAG: outer membrane lipoprotein carrier protein LolA, partial [Deltaproteobacteria bacterium]
PELNQVIVDRHFVSSQLTAAVSFLWGRGRLEDEFSLALEKYPGVDPKKFWVLELVPRGPAQFRRMLLVLEKPGGMVRRSIIEDPGGNVNVIRFSKVSTNTGLDDSAFVFTIPEGVDVVEVPAPERAGAGKRR